MTILTIQHPLEVLAREAGLVDASKLMVYASSAGSLPMSRFIKGKDHVYYDKKGEVIVLFAFDRIDGSDKAVLYQFDNKHFQELQKRSMPLDLSMEPTYKGDAAIQILERYARQAKEETEDV